MKLSNFVLTGKEGTTPLNKVFLAEVDVTTGFIFKKTVRRKIRREYASHWHFCDTGEFTPGDQAEALARSWTAQTGEET